MQVDVDSGRYLPVLYQEEMPYWDAARRKELVLQKCRDCGFVWYPIGPVCRRCLSENFDWRPMSGRGLVSSYVVYHKAWAPWLESQVPYVVAQVQLEEGPRLTTNLLGVGPSEVEVGMPVEVAFERITEEVTLVQFRQV